MYYRVEYTEADRECFLKLSNSGAIAVFIFTPNVLIQGKIQRYTDDKSVRAITKNGNTYVPLNFFSKFLGATESKTKDGFELNLGEKTARLSTDTNSTVDLIQKNGVFYAPIKEVSEILGFACGSYYENRLTVVGSVKHIATMNSNEKLAEAASYEIFGKFEAESFTHDDYKDAKDKWRLRLVGSPEINDISNPDVEKKISDIDERCKSRWEQMNKRTVDGIDPIILWGDYVPVESSELSKQFGGIFALAAAYGTYGSQYYKNPELLSDIIYALDWMYDHMYGEAEMAGTGWRDVRAFNWWYWHVGGPEYLTDTLLIIEDHLTMEDKKRYLKCYEWITTIMRTGPGRECSSSRLKCCTKTALLLEDPVRLEKSQWDCDTLFGIEEYGEGPHKDYVQWTHGFPHNISYALGNLQRTLFTSSILATTDMDFSGPKKYNQFMLMKYTFEPSMYLGQGFFMFMGRSTSGSMMSSGAAVLAGLLPMIGVYGDDEDAYIKRMIKRHSAHPEMPGRVRAQCSIYDLAKYNAILADDTIPYDNDYEYAHAWFTGDRAAQHRNNYAIGIAVSSEREVTYESINDANKTGWYTGDGALYLYTDYDAHQYDGRNFLTNNINVAYRFPGTTEDSQERVIRSILNHEAWKNPTAFAGSMQIHDKYLTCGMDFISMRFDGPDKNIVDTGYGAGLAVHHNDLVAKKAWFCFDDEIVALGAGISSTMNSAVHTTVEHKRIIAEKQLGQSIFAQGKEIKLPDEDCAMTLCDAKWALMEGHAGYVFLDDTKAYIGKYVCKESFDQQFFEMRVEHGENPSGATYAYAILPYANAEKLKKYSENPDIQILSNTSEVQAVFEKNIGMTGYVFHKGSTVEGRICANVPSLVTTVESNGEFEIYVCDPTHKLVNGEFIIPANMELISANNKLQINSENGVTVIKADFENAHGRTYIAKFKV